jgi:N-carbamoyl-L-amino-acid hydrolase
MIGSHIDSVPTAGQFDGCLGVLGGLEVIATLNAHAITTHRPMVVAFFTDEEGCRFGTDMLGSAVATGRLRLEDVYELRDLGGARLRDELEAIGFLGPADPHIRWPHAYLECHVEQGPLLGAKGVEIGVVSGVQGISWHELTLLGASAHAGTTPMALRHDSGIQPNPGLVNIIPGRTIATIDLRNPDEGRLRQMEAEVFAFCAEAAAEEGVELRRRQTARTPPVDFAPEIQERIAAAADDLGLSRTAIISGAGHDAQEFARICPTAMIFVPGEFQGISHNPRELSTREQCANGVNVLLQVARELAG